MPNRKAPRLLAALPLLVFALAGHAAAQGAGKTAYAVLLDNTRSMEKQFPQVLRLGRGVVSRVGGRGPVALFSFASRRGGPFVIPHANDADEGGNYHRAEAVLGAGWDRDEATLGAHLDALTVVRGQTALLEAVGSMAEALDAAAKAGGDGVSDKVIILITDGDHRMEHVDGGATETEDERRRRERRLVEELKARGIRVYAVGLIRELDAYGGFGRGTTKGKAESFLKRITKGTGGRVVFPRSKTFDVDGVLGELLPR